jgi:hypothetical protein
MSTTVENASLPELVRTLADDARELVRAEVGLAKDELGKTLRVLLIVIAGATAATVIAVFSLATFLAAAVLAAGGTPVAALLAAAGWEAALVIGAVIVSLQLLAKSKKKPKVAAPESEPTLAGQQREVVR